MQGSLTTFTAFSSPPSLPRAFPLCLQIVAIDLGKLNSVLCRFDPATAAHSFVTLATDREKIIAELERIAAQDRSSTLVVFETCEISGWVYDLVKPMGV